ncbi:MAG: hypothetical protein HOV87_08280, partial [Catenulispora sp.]|nr:hypothetical protein [Catenulispora sp.]
ARWRDGRLCGRSLREALPTYAARSRHGLAAGLGFPEDGADRLPVLAWPRADRIGAGRAGSADGDGLDGLGGVEDAEGSVAVNGTRALDGDESDPWYDSGTPVHPEKSDPWLDGKGGHLFESGDADEAGNPLFGKGSAVLSEELRSGAGASLSAPLSASFSAPLSAETAGTRGGESPDDTDPPRRESFSRTGVIPLYQGADHLPRERAAAGGDGAPTGAAPAGLPVLTWPRTRSDLALPGVGAEPARAVLSALAQACDLVVVDLPRSLDDAATEALALATTALIVVPAEVRAAAAASQLAAAVRLITPDLRVVVRLPAPGGLEPLDITDVMGGLPLAGVIGPDRRLSAAAEHGEPPGSSTRGSLSAFCRGFLDDLFGVPAGRRGSGTSGGTQSRAAA